ncbi:COP23 domain-containing protein [Aerosakkonema funiforme]|uniref:COP23 domain-containing protein n=1 Tax=Aerosakkonema funiforme TaxID=1246630 RepID=UPI0035B9762D
MKVWQYFAAFVASTTTLGFAFGSATLLSSHAQSAPPIAFECKEFEGAWTTIAKTQQQQRQFIRWVSDFGARAGYTPERRCNEVTNRMNFYVRTKYPQYLTTGVQSDYPIICVTDREGNGCQGLVYTLKKRENAKRRLQDMLELTGNDIVGKPPLVESRCPIYVKMIDFVEGRPSASYSPSCR